MDPNQQPIQLGQQPAPPMQPPMQPQAQMPVDPMVAQPAPMDDMAKPKRKGLLVIGVILLTVILVVSVAIGLMLLLL
ncbi:MAG: hypothetical protein M3P98_03640 [bacterium]|nr:hypothetical protein [bacterium]